jgi:hypothetical protein
MAMAITHTPIAALALSSLIMLWAGPGAAEESPHQGAPSATGTRPIVFDPPPPRFDNVVIDPDIETTFGGDDVKEPARDDSQHHEWLKTHVTLLELKRRYGDVEDIYREEVKSAPDTFSPHGRLSHILLLEGKYQEALLEADKALDIIATMNREGRFPGDSTFGYIILAKACCLHHSGRFTEAQELFNTIKEAPSGGIGHYNEISWIEYQWLSGYFSASTHNIADLKKRIAAMIGLQYSHFEVKTCAIFDEYRHLEWFIAIAGETLKPDN